MSNIRFQAYRSESTFLDPRKGFEPTSTGFEVRVDPLTGRSGHLSHFGAIKAQKLPLDAYATPEVKGFCPFCPSKRESHTPKFAVKFLGAERPARNEAVLIPNLFPYDIYNGVLIMTDSHVVPLEGMTEGRLRDAFSLGIDFLREIKERDPSLPYHLMTWNYMPPSGGGLVHPHQQYFASLHPGNQYMDELRASARFLEEHGANYWHELVEEERRLGERYLGQCGPTHWMTAFVSFGLLGEVIAVFPDVYSVDDFREGHLEGLVEGLGRLFGYCSSSGIYSFNASLSFGPSDQRSFSAHFRFVPRTFLNMRDYASDLNFFQAVLGEPVCVTVPEELCRDMAPSFAP